MVRYCDILIAQCDSCLRHLRYTVLTVTPAGMHMQIAFQIANLDQFWYLTVLSGFYLATVLSQLRWDICEPHALEHF